MKQRLFRAAKKMYQKLPVGKKTKEKMKGSFYRCFGFLFKDVTSYRVWKTAQLVPIDETNVNAPEEAATFEFTGKIAIHLHLYYTELTDEFVTDFSCMPYSFDLYISIVDATKKDEITASFRTIPNVKKVDVRVVDNRGRDVAPFLCVFGSDLTAYDYVCHVHSKKSLYSGSEQEKWRKYLLEGLFGDEKKIRQHFYMMEKGNNVGLLYPETFRNITYLGHAWLKNEETRNELLELIHVPYCEDDTFVDFPLGTMFWAKTSALRQFFESNLKVTEFPKEAGQNDGTIAHAFERCIGVVTRFNGFHSVIYKGDEKYCYDCGEKNMYQYQVKDLETMKAELMSYDIVSFDLFDTLISFACFSENGIFLHLEEEIDAKTGKASEFARLRKEAELRCRRMHPGVDCDIDDIYASLLEISHFSEALVEKIKKREFELFLAHLSPKKEMLEVYNALVSAGKTVYIISDMFLKRWQIEAICTKCGITKYRDILLSSEKNARKDDGSMWEYYLSLIDKSKAIHVGDNPKSDIQIPQDMGLIAYHILNGKDLWQLSSIGNVLRLIERQSLDDYIQLGLLAKHLFDNPFRYNSTKFQVGIANAESLGYAVFGPVVLNYCQWLVEEAKKCGANRILFCAREGYVLHKAFEELNLRLEQPLQSDYLYVSRRAVMVPNMDSPEAIRESLDIVFNGRFQDLVWKRFGIRTSTGEDEIILPDQKESVARRLQSLEQEIYENARQEREHYLKYFESLQVQHEHKTILADIGYSGTIQYYLSRMTGMTFEGRYMATDEKHRGELIEGNTMKGCYIDSDSEQELSVSPIHRYHLFLEAILTAPDGQLLHINQQGIPVFDDSHKPGNIGVLGQIWNGIYKYVQDYSAFGEPGMGASQNEHSRKLAEQMLQTVFRNGIVDESLKSTLVMEDSFGDSSISNPVDYYVSQNR